MLRPVGVLVALALVAATGLVTASDAEAGGATCVSYNAFGTCTLWAGGDPAPGSGPAPGGGSGSGDGTVPLIVIDGHLCGPAGLTDPQPLKSDPVWGGHTDGAIYDCVVSPAAAGGFVAPMTLQYWATSAPAVPPDPAQLAQQAVASMGLQAVRVGIVPEPVAGSVGLVGMPNWMWVAQPDAQTFGPITRTASAAAWTVTATARVQHVSWDMGDGQVINCTGPGTPYEVSYGKQASPDCGHTYTRQGTYTVRATSHWVVTWSGIGQAGTIPMDLTQTAPVTIGEAQVLVQ